MSNCSSWPDNCGELKPDADIAGRGVHTAFMVSAILAHLAALTHYICQLRISKSDPKRLHHWLSPKRAKNISSALKPFILSLSDQQMVTGLAILVAVSRNWDTISTYHFNIVVLLAWCSCITQALALLSLGEYLKQSRALYIVRLIGFVLVFIGCNIAQSQCRDCDTRGPVDGCGATFACPAACTARKSHKQSASLAIWVTFCVGIALVFLQVVTTLPVQVVTTIPLQVVTTAVFDDSMAFPAEVHSAFVKCWVRRLFKLLQWGTTVGGFVLGSYKMTSFETPLGIDGLEVANDFKEVEENWSFGQLMPIVFLALPVLAAAQGFIDEKAKHETLPSQTREVENRREHLYQTYISPAPSPQELPDEEEVKNPREHFDATATFLAPTPDQDPGGEPELLRPRTTSATFPNNQPRRRHVI